MAIGNMRKIVKIGLEIPWVLADKHRVRQTDRRTHRLSLSDMLVTPLRGGAKIS